METYIVYRIWPWAHKYRIARTIPHRPIIPVRRTLAHTYSEIFSIIVDGLSNSSCSSGSDRSSPCNRSASAYFLHWGDADPYVCGPSIFFPGPRLRMKETYSHVSSPLRFVQALHEAGGTPSHLSLRRRQLLQEIGCRLPLRPRTGDGGSTSARRRLPLPEDDGTERVRKSAVCVRYNSKSTTHSVISSQLCH
jgi:hypothetical protein